ncbi:InlB B-repeat-containing protein, partial [Oscillibacter valericigenes]|nr:InlB B-repeat-containing protein [Oscillibacter valericigenes]
MAKNLKRRGLALLMTIIMSISLLPINVMAEGDADSAGSASQTEESVSGDSSASTGDAATGDTSTGDAATGDTSTGDAATGDTSTGDAATGDTSTGDAATGDTSAGDAATGDTSTGDAATGDTSTGDAATGDTSTGDTGTVTDPAAPVTPVAPVTPADPATPAVPEKTPEELAKEEADRLVAEAAAKAEADRLAAEAAAKAEADRLAAERAAFEAAYPEISGEKSFNNVTASVNAPFGAFPAGTTLTIEPVKNGFMEGVVSAVKSLFGADAATTLSTLMENVEAATAEDETATGAVAFNITFTDAEGNEIQPNAEYPVDVRFEVASDNEMVAESSQLQVFHMEDETSVATPVGEPQAITDSSVAQEISVSSDHFSIWVVGGVTEKPTATYTYYVNGAKYSEQIVKDGETLNQPEAPASTETGKIFVGWYTTAEGGELFTAFGATAVSKTQEINLYARFDTKYYVFYKESETGRVVATQEYANGAAVDTASVAYSVKADQALVGWSTNPTATAADKNLTVNGGNITLYPVVKNAHWITFNSNEGSPVDPMYVLSGESTGTLPASTRAGYKFDGWYTASGDKFTGGKLTENITLTAKWTAQESNYTVVYWQENADDNGYTYVEKVSRSGKTGDEATYKNKSYTGFKLNTTKTDAENVTISGDGTTIKNVYYSRNTYTLTFRSRDAICGKWHWHTDSCYVVASFSGIKFGEKTTSYWNQANNKVSSYLWFTTSNGSTAYSEPPTMPQKNLTVYGEYNAAVSYIYYYEKGTTKEIHPTFQLNRSGWTFSDEDYIVLPGFTFANSDGPSTSGGRYVGKLYYTRNNYNITFNTNGGPNVTAVNQIPYETNISGKAPGSYEVGKTTKTVNGETLYFAGWYDNEACAGDAFSFSGKTMPAKNLLLYAKWTSKTFTVTFDANGGTAVAAMETVPFGSTIDEEDTVTTRNGYTFGGWTLDGKPFSFGTPVTKDLALKAVWLNSEGYSVTYSAGEGSGSVTDSGKYAEGTQAQVSSAASLTAPTGKVFVGWADASGNVYYPGSLVTVPKNGVTLTAQWADVNKTASLTYDPNGGTHTGNHEDLTVTSITNNGTVTLASPASLGITHDGYKFDGWNTQKDGNGESFAAGAVVRVDNIGNNVLYAQWKQTAHTLTVNYVIEGG